jgi:hypothetical protein
MSDPKFIFTYDVSTIAHAFNAQRGRLGQASKKAATELAQNIVRAGRANIAGAGFGKRWQEGFVAEVYPKGGAAINESIYVKHKNNLARVFEFGTTTSGKPLMWLPFDNVPLRPGSNVSRMSPRQFVQSGGKLQYVKGKTAPLLMGDGVPMFVGVTSATIPKKFDLIAIAERESARLPELLAKHLIND